MSSPSCITALQPLESLPRKRPAKASVHPGWRLFDAWPLRVIIRLLRYISIQVHRQSCCYTPCSCQVALLVCTAASLSLALASVSHALPRSLSPPSFAASQLLSRPIPNPTTTDRILHTRRPSSDSARGLSPTLPWSLFSFSFCAFFSLFSSFPLHRPCSFHSLLTLLLLFC